VIALATVYLIRDWKEHFEVSQTRKVDTLRWVPTPVKHDGLSFRRVMSLEDGLAVFGAWNLILQVAGKCKERGTLRTDAGRPMTAEDIAIMTGAPKEGIARGLQVLTSEDVGWVDTVDSSELESNSTQVALHNRTGQDKDCCAVSDELPQAAPSSVEPSEFVFQTAGKGPKQWALSKAKLAQYVTSYPSVDVPNEMRKARQWCEDKPRNRKTANGMPAFLTGWLNRVQNKGGGRDIVDTGYRKVSPEEFKAFVGAKKFKDGPIRSQSDPHWVYGTLRTGEKVECKTYPAPAMQ
jgi:hypothetical protein